MSTRRTKAATALSSTREETLLSDHERVGFWAVKPTRQGRWFCIVSLFVPFATLWIGVSNIVPDLPEPGRVTECPAARV